MKLDKNCALLVIDIQQEDFMEMNESNMYDPRWEVIRNGKRVLDVFRAKKLPVIQIKECHRPDMVDFGRELDGSEDIHCVENRPENDYANLTYPIEGEYLISKRRYSAFFATDLEILLKGLGVDTLYLIGGLTDVCIHYTAVDAHQNDYHIHVVKDAVAGSSKEAHEASLRAIHYLQHGALITTADVESALAEDTSPEDEAFMREAIRLSELAVAHGNEPFGAVLVKDGNIVFTNENQIYTKHDPTFHGEAGLIRTFCDQTGITDLREYTLYSSCEPCFMCSGAMVWVKLGRLVYGASNMDLEAILGSKGCNCSKMVFDNSSWQPQVTEGVLREESLVILKEYFGKHTAVLCCAGSFLYQGSDSEPRCLLSEGSGKFSESAATVPLLSEPGAAGNALRKKLSKIPALSVHCCSG